MAKSNKLNEWFGLSYASFLTLPRSFMQEMTTEWQDKMAVLLNEYDETFINQPELGTTVRVTKDNKLIKAPEWLLNYRRPHTETINSFKSKE